MSISKKITESEWRHACDLMSGYCTVCKEWSRENCEPDAREYPCPKCGEKTVFGAEECMIMGLVDIVPDDRPSPMDSVPSADAPEDSAEDSLGPVYLNKQSLAVVRVVSKDETRQHISGVLVTSDGATVATDGHRLALVTSPRITVAVAETYPEASELAEDTIVPKALVDSVYKDIKKRGKRLDDKFKFTSITCEDSDLSFRTNNGQGEANYGGKAVDSSFPPYKKIIPSGSDSDNVIGVNAKYLKDLAQMFIDFDGDHITLTIPENPLDPIKAEAENPETGQKLVHILMPVRL